ncbi:hypothetical protein CRYUN_Cryun05aG0104400 [Craigia yunnanensis]
MYKTIFLLTESSRVEVVVLLNELAYSKYEASKSSSSIVKTIISKQQKVTIVFSLVEKILKLISTFGETEVYCKGAFYFPCTQLSLYNDTNMNVMRGHHSKPKTDSNFWHTLGGRAERNKENNAMPAKWTSYKILHRAVARTVGAVASAHIEVFDDEEYVK